MVIRCAPPHSEPLIPQDYGLITIQCKSPVQCAVYSLQFTVHSEGSNCVSLILPFISSLTSPLGGEEEEGGLSLRVERL